METVTLKTSTIFVSNGSRTRVFRSTEDMPRPLRQKLARATSGKNSATILIADRKGREELIRAIQGKPSSIPLRLTENARVRRAQQERRERLRVRRSWLEAGLIVVLGILLWVLAFWK